MDQAKGRILIVDDEEPIRLGVSRRLQAEGYTCLTASDGKEALETASQHDFDLVLMDLKMPGVSGLQVLPQMIADHPDTAVVMATAVADAQTAVDAMKLGAYDYVTKPFSLEALSMTVEKALERKRLIQENKDYKLRLAEEALEESEKQYAALIQNIADAVFMFKDGAVVWGNDRMQEMLGYAKDEMIGVGVELFFSDERALREVYKAVDGDLKESGHFQGTTRAKKKDGSSIDIEYTASLIQGKDPIEVVGVARDITERKKAEEALRESEARYRMLAENVTDVIWAMDMNLNFTYVSPSTERLIGYTPQEEMAIGLAGIVTPESLEVAFKAYETGLAGENRADQNKPFGSMTVELDHIHKDGHVVPTEVRMTFLRDSEGRPVGILGVTRDMSQHKEMERELQQSEESHRLVVESLNDGVIVVEVATMTIVFSNRRGARLCGFDSVDDFIGTNALSFVHSEDCEAVASAFAENLYEERRQRYEVRLVGIDGEVRWVSLLATRMEFHERLAVLLSVKDIAELKKAEEEKHTMEQQMLLSGRLASIGELAAGIAHELNNPMTAIQGFAELLAGRKDLEESVREDVDTIFREARRASKVCSNLLSFARKHSPEKSLISVNEVVERSVELHAYRMRVNDIEVLAELDPDLPRTMADGHQMQQVFVNIITNAEQAMTEAHGKGTLTVEIEEVDAVIRITFTDDGPGIPRENLDRIFDPFFTTKEEGKGTGLGLGICFGIVQAHDGRIYARSNPGEGTTFVVEIPIISEAQTTGGETDAIQGRGVTNGPS